MEVSTIWTVQIPVTNGHNTIKSKNTFINTTHIMNTHNTIHDRSHHMMTTANNIHNNNKNVNCIWSLN